MNDPANPSNNSRRLRRSDLNPHPIEQFRQWFQEASEAVPVDWFEANAMALATSSPTGEVSCRIVLLKEIEEGGLVFFTNYESRKGRNISENPRAAVVIHWPHLARQVRVEGGVSRVDRETSASYFYSRPRGSQISAAISKQSGVIPNRKSLEQLAEQLASQHEEQPVPLPDNWGGYRLTPNRFEFWQGRENRLHDRFMYTRDDDQWQIDRLAP
jgi:pyridoxamine 5'-phosphate oxidase